MAASPNRKRVVLSVGVLVVVAITTFAVLQLWPADDPVSTADEPDQPTTALALTNRFLDAFAAGDATGAGALTDNPAAATAQLTEVWRTLQPSDVSAGRDALVEPSPDVSSAEEKFTLDWRLGTDHTWTYENMLPIVKQDKAWRVKWQPSIVHPKLAAGQSLALRERTDQPAVLDATGTPLLTWAQSDATPVDPAVAPLLLPGLTRTVEGLDKDGGWYVALVDGAGADVELLYGDKAVAQTASVSRPVQQAAQAAVNTQQLPTMIVAIQPSTGDLLAVAQNSAAGADPIALSGLYPPGSTFKIATAAALLEAGVADVGTVVPCPGTATIGQRTIQNAGFELGDVPLRTAFAQSCNTTFAMQAANLPPDSLPAAADQFGLGADFDIPGITTETGAVPTAANETEQVENSIGQGTVQVSCLGLALMTATVAAGHPVTPRLWHDIATEVGTSYEAPPDSVLRGLRTMMRDVVTSGRGSALNKYGAVFGKTGTAEVSGGGAHGWFAGYRDDIAFATLVLTGTSSGTAVDVTGAFLGALG